LIGALKAGFFRRIAAVPEFTPDGRASLLFSDTAELVPLRFARPPGDDRRATCRCRGHRRARRECRFERPRQSANVRRGGRQAAAVGLGSRVNRQHLQQFAEMSGPMDVMMLVTDYRRTLDELRRRYVIAYESSNRSRDGNWRSVEIGSGRDQGRQRHVSGKIRSRGPGARSGRQSGNR